MRKLVLLQLVLLATALGGCYVFLDNYSASDGGPPAAGYGALTFIWCMLGIVAVLFVQAAIMIFLGKGRGQTGPGG